MNTNLKYEIKAEAFNIMTGQMAPGKDSPSAAYSGFESFQKRANIYDAWTHKYTEIIEAMLIATSRILDLDEEK